MTVALFGPSAPLCAAATALGAALVLLGSQARAEAPSPELMQKLGEQASRDHKRLEQATFTTATRIEELDKKGKPEMVIERLIAHRFENGQRKREVLRATKDGKDDRKQAAKELEEQEKNPDQKKKQGRSNSPFHPANQPGYRFTQLASPEPRRVAVKFEPVDSKNGEAVVGVAQVDSEAGEVVSMRCSPVKLPPHADRIEISSEFARSLPDSGRLLSKLTVDGDGGVLFVHKHFVSVTTFSMDAPSP